MAASSPSPSRPIKREGNGRRGGGRRDTTLRPNSRLGFLSADRSTRGERSFVVMFPGSIKRPVDRDADTQFSRSSEKLAASTSKRHLNPAKDLNLGQNPFQFEDTNNSNPVSSLETPVNPELSSRWVKRLKSNYSNSVALNSEGVKVENGPQSVEIHNLFSRALKNKGPKPILMNSFEEEAVFVKEKQSPKAGQGSLGVPLKDMKCWIKRWSRNNSQIIPDKERMETATMSDGEETKAVSEKCEARKSPSAAAMAMTGNNAEKVHSC
ncbi:uncharacterized protein LOC109721318 [Ananas comosus]|uniref:Uncharacterized protein LOC109721318 n=1 Tax=Ananas comosus TaxID=4615 RepID=A0A6P5G9I1_ANACO|nr:uncharacterized protein LOC109721318 [Ananas comosus]